MTASRAPALPPALAALPPLLGGEVHNSAAASRGTLASALDRLAALGGDAAFVPLYWELLEPEEGAFDFASADTALDLCRERGLRFVPLWFGAFKNAISCYAPAWVKTGGGRFPRARDRGGRALWTLSCFEAATRESDARAFAAVMAHLRGRPGAAGAIPFVQVENEVGILGTPRDFSPAAEAAFRGDVPPGLLRALEEADDGFAEPLRPLRGAGGWEAVFGEDAAEVFMAWHIARYVDAVAAAGRAAWDLPMGVNAWLDRGPGYQAGDYPSGGPTARMLPVWRAAAPRIDFVAPDIYDPDFRGYCAAYTRLGNPLLIPESRADAGAGARALYALGRHEALGFAPFGVEDLPADAPLGAVYRLLRPMGARLAAARGAGRLAGFLQQADEETWDAELDGWRLRARTRGPTGETAVPGAALVLAEGDDTFTAVGQRIVFTFERTGGPGATAGLLWLDEGRFEDGAWRAARRLNGDETAHGTGALFGDTVTAVRFRLHAY